MAGGGYVTVIGGCHRREAEIDGRPSRGETTMRKAELEIAHEKALRTLDAIDVQLYRVYPTDAE